MKNKFCLLLVLFMMSATFSYGQVRLGIRGGIHASKLKTSDELVTSEYRITYPKYALLGYHVGLVSQVQLFNFFIQPELLYTVTRNDINIYDLNSPNPTEAQAIEQQLNRIDIPVLFGMKLNILKLEVGPVATFLISDDSDLERITTYDLQLNRATIGFQAGAGLDVGRLALDVKYEGSLSKFGDGISVGDNDIPFDSRIHQLVVSVGLFF